MKLFIFHSSPFLRQLPTFFLTAILFMFPLQACSQWISIGTVVNFEKQDNGVVLSVPPAKVQIKILSPDVIRIRMTKDGYFLPDKSWAVVTDKLGEQSFELKETTDKIFLTTSKLTVRIQKSPCRISFLDKHGNIINQDEPTKGICWSGNEIAVWKSMPKDEYYFGFGEKAGALNKKGKSLSMWNSDIPAYKAYTDPLYQTIPFFYGIRNGKTYGIFLDNTYYSFSNMGKENPDQYSFGANDGELNYYFINGPKPKDVLDNFSKLIGTTPLPPKWAIGYQQCRWSYYPESKVREIATTFRSKNIPCDVIYLDIHYMDGYKCFTWDKERFPDPKKMVSDLANDGFKIVTIIDPGIKNEPGYWVYDEGVKGNHFVKHADGNYFVGKVWPGDCVFPDYTRKETRDWWGSLHQEIVDVGIRGFWVDMNEPSVFDTPNKTFPLDVLHDDDGMKTDHRKNHNIYGMQMARATHEGALTLQQNERPFVLTRANYAGGNRYAAAWTGDNVSSWEHLEMAVPMCLNLSISGQPFVGADIGGFVGNPSGELYARWLQLGIFTPLMRTHTEINSKDQEPWSYGTEYEAINKKSIELRYKLLPYIYTQFYKASKDGTPIMRPIFFDYPEDTETYWNDKEFFFGETFLVVPVLKEGQTMRDVRLPAGEWYNFWSGEKFVGPKYLRFETPIERILLFVKAGSIIPSQQLVQYTDEAPIDPMELDIYPAKEDSTILYEDDGLSFDYQKGGYCLRSIKVKNNNQSYVIQISKPEGNYRPSNRTMIIKFNDSPRKPFDIILGDERINDDIGRWSYDEEKKIIRLIFTDNFEEQMIKILF
ncbi:MAG: glycoside hydrolase family 31 protein [Bacteroidota bacterium]|nr:glycoside hydrolase family 31 protein [Bacteroidota bacterium]